MSEQIAAAAVGILKLSIKVAAVYKSFLNLTIFLNNWTINNR